eukprot:TRINITY_DN10211_c0_g1_i1.p1 TRINITY_DN10211_c0_g1~~TRINITY_DN10211_c0_g1_i1.p1  ORF type:complete len:303 (-),score=19.85 TRINITY_DN10211_c0_g1_i1:20-928(-)
MRYHLNAEILVLLAILGVCFALEGTRCPFSSVSECQGSCSPQQVLTRCDNTTFGCFPVQGFGVERACCGCKDSYCTSCRDPGYCIRSPDSTSGWECSRFSLMPPGQNHTNLNLRWMKCALAVNDLVLHAQYTAYQAEYASTMSKCISERFLANGGRSEKPEMSFNCPASPGYRQFCSDLRGSLCNVVGYMSNWLTMPAGAFTVNFTSEACVPSACFDLGYEKQIADIFNPYVENSFCVNGTQLDEATGACFAQIQCTPPPVRQTIPFLLQRNNDLNIGIVAGFATVLGLLILFLIICFVRRR